MLYVVLKFTGTAPNLILVLYRPHLLYIRIWYCSVIESDSLASEDDDVVTCKQVPYFLHIFSSTFFPLPYDETHEWPWNWILELTYLMLYSLSKIIPGLQKAVLEPSLAVSCILFHKHW